MANITENREFWIECTKYTNKGVLYIYPIGIFLNVFAMLNIDFMLDKSLMAEVYIFRGMAIIGLLAFWIYSRNVKNPDPYTYHFLLVISICMMMLPVSFVGAQIFLIQNSLFVGMMGLLQVEFVSAVIALMHKRLYLLMLVIINSLYVIFHLIVAPDMEPERISELVTGIGIFGVLSFAINNIIVKNKFSDYTKRMELVKVNLELEKINAQKDKLFSVISHDLISPVQSLQLSSELLGKLVHKNSYLDLVPKSQSIQHSVAQLKDQLLNLLYWSRYTTGRLELVPTFANLKHSVEKEIRNFDYQIKRKNLRIYTNLENTQLKGDAELLGAAIRNLISNAIIFSEQDGFVKIDVVNLESEVEVKVSDEGQGIELEKLKHIFEIEKRQETRGAGIGLIISRKIIEMHGGKLELHSIANKGTVASFVLPYSSSI